MILKNSLLLLLFGVLSLLFSVEVVAPFFVVGVAILTGGSYFVSFFYNFFSLSALFMSSNIDSSYTLFYYPSILKKFSILSILLNNLL